MSLSFANDEMEQSKITKFSKKIEELCENLEQEKFVLLIFDNVDEVKRIAKFVPSLEKLHVILTSNFQEIHDIGHQVEINKFSDDEAKLMLYQKSKNISAENLENVSTTEQTTMLKIAELLGHHPFALTVAGLYIRNKQKTFEQYLNRLQNTQGKILKDESGVNQYQHPTIYSAFLIPFNDVLETNGDSKEAEIVSQISLECLKVAALLSSGNMPEEVFTETMNLIFPHYAEFIADEDSWDNIYQKLSTYGIFERNPYLKTFSIHRLFQLFLKEELKQEIETVERPLLKVLDSNFEHFDFNNKVKTDRYSAHIKVFLKFVEDTNIEEKLNRPLESETTFLLRRKLAKYYLDIGLFDISKNLFRLNKEIVKEIIGDRNILYAMTLNDEANILITHRYNSDKEEDSLLQAEKLVNQAIEIAEKFITKNEKFLRSYSELEICKKHLSTFYGALVNIYALSGEHEKAILVCKELLSALELTGEENTALYATRLNNLALAYAKNNQFEDAINVQRKSLKLDKKTLPKNHTDYHRHLLNYANILSDFNKIRFAGKIYNIAKFYFDNDFYENHPEKANFYFWLGLFNRKINKLLKAQESLELSIHIYAQDYGYQNPNTIRAIEELKIVKQIQEQSKG